MELEVYYQLKHEPGQLPETLRLRDREWTVLLSLDGNQSVEQTLKKFGMKGPELKQMLEKFRREDLIEDAQISYAEFVRRQESAKKNETLTNAAPRSVPQFKPLPVPASASPVRAEIPPAAPKTVDRPESERKLNLKAVMDFIIRQAGGDPNAGQLAVYRVFMRVDTKLLRRNGISSLRFQDDRLVSDPELEAAIADSIQSALGTRMPESAFAGE